MGSITPNRGGVDKVTEWDYMVSMTSEKWDFERIEKIFEEFLGGDDPKDPRERKRRRIINTATELFIERGYRRTNVESIARRAGVAKGTVYLYFSTKAEILLYAIIFEKKRYIGRLKPIFQPDVPPKEKLRKWLELALVLSNEMPLISRLMSGDRELLIAMEEMPEDVMIMSEMIKTEFLGGLVDAAAAPHSWNRMEIEDRANVIHGLAFFSALIADERVRGGLSLERFATILSDMVVDGISPSNPGEERPTIQEDNDEKKNT